jgi:hypothetical protein
LRLAAILGLIVVVVLAASVLWAARRSGRGRGVPDPAVARATGVPDTPAARALLGRWRDRARRWRTTAALPLVIVAVVGGLAMEGQVGYALLDTVGGAPLWTDVLVVGLLGATVGAFGAELHQARRRPEGPRSADLTPREVGGLRHTASARRRLVLVLAALAAVGGHGAVVAVGAASGVPWSVVGALVVLGASEVVERRIAARPRPVLPSDLAAADDAIRRVGVRSVDEAASGAAVILVGWASLGVLGVAPGGGRLLDPAVVVVPITCIALAVRWWWRSAPHRLLDEAAPAGAPT